MNDGIGARQPWKPSIGEDLRGNPALTRPTAEGGAGFDARWDGGFVHAMRRELVTSDDTARDVGERARAVAGEGGGDPLRRVIYTESHDEVA
ncbi:MAG: hypothetical protein ABIJ48_06010 [Actinomycetota bacterium]